MKKIFWVLFLLPFFSRAQSVFIDSFEGVKFGVSQSDAIKAAQLTGASLNYIDKEEELVFLSNLKVAGVRSKLAYMKFVDDHFFEGVAEFDVDKSNFIPIFNHLKLQLTKIYGYGKDFSWFEPPFYFGDGNEFLAIVNKKGKLCHAWGNLRQITADNFVVLEVGPDKKIRMVFQSHHFAKMSNEKARRLSAKN